MTVGVGVGVSLRGSGGPILGPELVVNGDASDGINGWTTEASGTLANLGSEFTWSPTVDSTGNFYNTVVIPVTVGATYKYGVTTNAFSGVGSIGYSVNDSIFNELKNTGIPTVSGIFSDSIVIPVGVTGLIFILDAGGMDAADLWTFIDITCREILRV